MKKRVSILWTFALSIFCIYIWYQSTYTWEGENVEAIKHHDIAEDKTAFLMITDNYLGGEEKGIKKLQESLEMWSYDKKREKVLLKHANLLPNELTKMMIVYDRGNTSFERSSEVLSIINFPYTHYVDKEPVFTIEGIDEKGGIYLIFEQRRIYLGPDESYYAPSMENFHAKVTTVRNHGLYKKEQFALEKEDKILRDAAENNKPKSIDWNQVQVRPLN